MSHQTIIGGRGSPSSDTAEQFANDDRFFGIDGQAKRLIDLVMTLPVLIFISPLLITLAILIKLDDGGPVLFKQARLGRHGNTFSMLKFRTMRVGADALLEQYLKQNPDQRREWNKYQKLKADPRITRLGKFLRKSSLDELPQLLNILLGDMSVVGQRPILPVQREAFGGHIEHYERARPGLTGLWQVSGRNALSFEDRARLGTLYAERWSLIGDFKLILKTVPVVLMAQDSF